MPNIWFPPLPPPCGIPNQTFTTRKKTTDHIQTPLPELALDHPSANITHSITTVEEQSYTKPPVCKHHTFRYDNRNLLSLPFPSLHPSLLSFPFLLSHTLPKRYLSLHIRMTSRFMPAAFCSLMKPVQHLEAKENVIAGHRLVGTCGL